MRSSILFGLLALFLACGSVLAGAPPAGPQSAVAADETTEETTTEVPPVVETPIETETPTQPETPATTTPPVTTPPVGAPLNEGGGATVESPKSTPSTGSESSSGGGGGGGSGGGSSSGSTGSGSSGGATTTSPTTPTNRHTTRTPSRAPTTGGGGGGGGSKGTSTSDGSKVASGGDGGNRNTSGGRHSAPSNSGGGGPIPQPTVSTQSFDEGASAVSNAASHVGEAFAKALPTAPLKKIGDQLAAHIAGADAVAKGGDGEKAAADGIGKALGAALIGAGVAVDKQPVESSSPISFITPPGAKSSPIYLILIAALLLGVGALIVREVRKSLGFGVAGTAPAVADEKPRTGLKERLGVAPASATELTQNWFSRFRRLRSNAAAGLRSLF